MLLSKKINYLLCILPVLIFSLGYFTHLSTSSERASSQLVFFIIGYSLFWLMTFFDYRMFDVFYNKIYLFILILLVLVVVIGETTLGSVRWLSIGGFRFQPSEIAKFGLVLFLAFHITKNFNKINNFKSTMSLLLYLLPLILLVLIQPDLGSSIILIIVILTMLFISGLHWLYYFGGFCLMGILSTPLWHLLHDYQKQRILVFLNPNLDTQGKGYNVIQSLISIGSGGIWGKGFGRGTQTHLNFLPIYWTDFVFAGFAEEWGLIGVLIMLVLFFGLIFTLIYIIIKASDQLGSILTVGVFSVIFSQVLINIGMNMGLMPVTGIPLPLVSYGGTSMISSLLLLGLAHSVWVHRKI